MPVVTGNRLLRRIFRALDPRQGGAAGRGFCWHAAGFRLGDISMMDVIMIAIGVVFFALSIGYVYACDRL